MTPVRFVAMLSVLVIAIVRIENHAVVCLAGDAAQRKLHPRSHYRAQSDQDQALEVLDYISGSE